MKRTKEQVRISMKFQICLLSLLFAAGMLQAQDIPLSMEIMADMPTSEAFRQRKTVRDFRDEPLAFEELGGLLWAANGYNRPEENKRTAPSARNAQEIDIYVFTEEGVYIYMPKKHMLTQIVKGDYRRIISEQKHFAVAPVSLVLVANYENMKNFDEESKVFYSTMDCGYVSENIYLYCAASSRLGTVACGGINRDDIAKIIHLKNGKVLLAHPIGVVDERANNNRELQNPVKTKQQVTPMLNQKR
ncbi:MAG: SagB/ThcOx family dehydrogenase [Bacteroidales bacterium]|nr:SagB/ThcOx family dehydrogenase [Bacteroidales bacterium]